VSDERYEDAVREVLDFLPDTIGGSGADREARAIVDRVLACYRVDEAALATASSEQSDRERFYTALIDIEDILGRLPADPRTYSEKHYEAVDRAWERARAALNGGRS
jgi:hypothetical protein